MASLNLCQFIGRLGSDPEVRTLGNGDRVANLRLAVSETWKDKSTGERKEKTEWVRVTVFNDNLVKVCESYLKKGSQIYVSGQMQTRKWTDQSGVEKFSTEINLSKFRGEITMLDSKSGGERQADTGGSSSGDAKPNEDWDADPIPFVTQEGVR